MVFDNMIFMVFAEHLFRYFCLWLRVLSERSSIILFYCNKNAICAIRHEL